ncbi:MAG: hypothetical protein KDC66_13370 [Phaeodactylibacter sp.]|nr:hypothetical protein [Phaeodactylibacter sp.]MCB9275211.1 hypothetical protein [Lewinellaceae bacterium]
MSIEEWRIDWLPAPEEIVIALEGYAGPYPVLLEVYGPDGKRVFRQQYPQPLLSLPTRLLRPGHYRYKVIYNGKNVQDGTIAL